MTNNDILRSVRYARDYSDSKLLSFFREGGAEVSPKALMAFLKQEEQPGYEPLSDVLLGQLLDGLVAAHRGKRPDADGSAPRPPLPMSNNRVLRALKIAYELKDTDIISVLERADFLVSKGELSALFRRQGHPNFQPCGDQLLRYFLRGLGLAHRDSRQGTSQ